MSAPSASGQPMNPERLERELLARLGLDPSATPEDVDEAHVAVSSYLASAPRQLRAWARVQAAGADEAYALLTDPAALARAVALVGAGARPAVSPGGPATPPARREPSSPAPVAVPPTAAGAPAPSRRRVGAAAIDPGSAGSAAPAALALAAAPQFDEDGRRIVNDDEIDELLAEVNPDAHRDVIGTPRQRAAVTEVHIGAAPRQGILESIAASRTARNIALLATTLAAIAIIAVVVKDWGQTSTPGIGAGSSPAASAAPVLDQATVAALMEKIQANPKDTDSLMALGNEYYKIGDYATAATWFGKVTAADPKNVKGFLALGAAEFNLGDLAAAGTAWNAAVALDDKSVEGHYDLGFLYLNQQPPDMAGVQREWKRVVELDPNGKLAQTVKSHLDAFASFSPAPASGSPSGSPAGSGAPSSPAASPATSPAQSPAASPAPSGSTAP